MPRKNLHETKELLTPKRATSVVLISHGLNNSQACLDEMTHLVDKSQNIILTLLLAGHEKSSPKTSTVPWDKLWISQMASAMAEAQKLSNSQGIPLIFLGFSLSCIVFLNALKKTPIPFDRVIFFSPPLQMGSKFHLMELLGKLGLTQVPSFNLPTYRAHSILPITYYNALFTLIRNVESTDTHLLPKQGLIFLDRRDEMVSPSLIESWLKTHNLPWEVAPIALGSRRFPVFRHLIVIKSNIGADCFALIQHGVKEFLTFGKVYSGAIPLTPSEYGCLQSNPQPREIPLDFPDRIDQPRLEEAIREAQLTRPLLRSRLNGALFQSRRHLSWLILRSGFAPTQKNAQTPISLLREIGLRISISSEPEPNRVIFQIHPACLDSQGAQAFVQDVLDFYEREKTSA